MVVSLWDMLQLWGSNLWDVHTLCSSILYVCWFVYHSYAEIGTPHNVFLRIFLNHPKSAYLPSLSFMSILFPVKHIFFCRYVIDAHIVYIDTQKYMTYQEHTDITDAHLGISQNRSTPKSSSIYSSDFTWNKPSSYWVSAILGNPHSQVDALTNDDTTALLVALIVGCIGAFMVRAEGSRSRASHGFCVGFWWLFGGNFLWNPG